MKKSIFSLLIWTLALVFSSSATAQTKIFKEAAAIKGVTSVYISPALLERGAEVGALGYGLDDAVEQLTGLEVIMANSVLDQKPQVMDLCRKAYAALKTSLLVDINEDGESVKLYAQLENGTYARQMVLEINDEQGDYTVIYIRGKIDISKIIQDNLRFK